MCQSWRSNSFSIASPFASPVKPRIAASAKRGMPRPLDVEVVLGLPVERLVDHLLRGQARRPSSSPTAPSPSRPRSPAARCPPPRARAPRRRPRRRRRCRPTAAGPTFLLRSDGIGRALNGGKILRLRPVAAGRRAAAAAARGAPCGRRRGSTRSARPSDAHVVSRASCCFRLKGSSVSSGEAHRG